MASGSLSDARRMAGVTLLELLIAVALVGILTAIAVPSYRAYVVRANRSDAKIALLSLAAALERCYTRNNSYLDAPPNAACAVASSLPYTVTNGDYLISADPTPPAPHSGINAQGFALIATPQGAQAEDVTCGSFTLDDTSQRGVTGRGLAGDCWAR